MKIPEIVEAKKLQGRQIKIVEFKQRENYEKFQEQKGDGTGWYQGRNLASNGRKLRGNFLKD